MTRVIVAHVRAQTPRTHTRIYVGRASSYRPGLGEDFSALGNPFPLSRHTREEAIALYAQRFQQGGAMQAAAGPLRQRLEAGENLALLCWCAPQPCHADVIRDWLGGGEK